MLLALGGAMVKLQPTAPPSQPQPVAAPRTFRSSDIRSSFHAQQILESCAAALLDPSVRSGVVAQYTSALAFGGRALRGVRTDGALAGLIERGVPVELEFVRYEKLEAGAPDGARARAQYLGGIPMLNCYVQRVRVTSAEELARAIAQANVPHIADADLRGAGREDALFVQEPSRTAAVAPVAARPSARALDSVTGPVTRTSAPASSEPTRRWWER